MSVAADRLARARTVADTVLYEGYLLYPYRASAEKNQVRWQFGVLGPPGAFDRGLGEPDSMTMHTLLRDVSADSSIVVHLRYLQLQHRQVRDPEGRDVDSFDGHLTWDEAVEQEVALAFAADLSVPCTAVAESHADSPVEKVGRASVVRRRWELRAEVTCSTERHGDLTALTINVSNRHPDRPNTKHEASRTSLLGAHLLVEARDCSFVSVVDPPEEAKPVVDGFRQDRCWPFLAGEEGDDDLLLGSPIILYDHPEVAAESAGALFDATEIDEILTLRVMTMTDAEKAEARATDPRAAAIIDRCDAMSPQDLQRLHGVFRDPRGPFNEETDALFDPDTDAVVVDGVEVRKGSLVRVHPNRRADAQDLFFDDQVARVTAVLSDVDGGTHIAVVLADDPAADLHDWYGRYFYFAPDEVEPLDPAEEPQKGTP